MRMVSRERDHYRNILMGGGGQASGGVKPLTVEQVFDLVESAVADLPLSSPAALLCRVEDFLLRGTGATSVEVFLVDRFFNKLLHFFPITRRGSGEGGGKIGNRGRSQGQQQHKKEEREKEEEEDADADAGKRHSGFDTQAVCDIGEGVAGMAALTGRKLRIRDCHQQQGRRPDNPVYSTHHDCGSLVCWPVQGRPPLPPPSPTAESWDNVASPSAEEKEIPPLDQMEDIDMCTECDGESFVTSDSVGGAVLAVLQLHWADGELPPEAVEVLHGVGRLLVPLLTDALTRNREYLRQRSTEAELSLSRIVPRDMDLVTMIEEVVDVAQRMMEVERVCFFFVDDAADELWVAKSMDFDGANIKIGEGLCGHAAATGGIVNVIDSYKDSRFDRRWDKQTGFATKSVLCVPVPPPDQSTVVGNSRAAKDRDMEECLGQESPGARDGETGTTASSWRQGDVELAMPTAADETQSPEQVESTLKAQAKVAQKPPPQIPFHRRSSKMPARPLAVVEVINKQGTGFFNEHDEEALVRLCSSVESLLRRKAAEVSILWSGMTERSLIRKRNNAGVGGGVGGGGVAGGGGGWSNAARVESTMMRLYSGATIPVEPVMLARSKTGVAAAPGVGEGEGDGGGNSGRARSAGDGVDGDVCPVQVGKDGHHRLEGSGRDVSQGPAAVPGVADGTLNEDSAQEDAELVDLTKSLFDLSSEQLLSLVGRFFRNLGLADFFQISAQKMSSFVRGVGQRYRPNAFHNLTHAVSVTHASFVIVKTTRVISLLRPLDKLALLVAAFCHDIDHPGNNNDYEVNSLSPLALQHGDSSVLERHHVFVTYQVILEEGGANNIFSGLTRAQFRDARKTIVQAILGTDMSLHMQHCADLYQFVRKAKRLRAGGGDRGVAGGVGGGGTGTCCGVRQGNGQGGGRPLSPPAVPDGGIGADSPRKERPQSSDELVARSASAATTTTTTTTGGGGGGGGGEGMEGGVCGEPVVLTMLPPLPPPEHVFCVDRAEDRSFLTRTILHCADLSGQVVENQLALEWGRRILEEFRLQGEREASAGLPLTMVSSEDMETTMKGQHFFAAKIVKPLWEPFVELFPELDPLLENLNNNCDFYLQEKLRLEHRRLNGAASDASNPTAHNREGGAVTGADDGSERGGGSRDGSVDAKSGTPAFGRGSGTGAKSLYSSRTGAGAEGGRCSGCDVHGGRGST